MIAGSCEAWGDVLLSRMPRGPSQRRIAKKSESAVLPVTFTVNASRNTKGPGRRLLLLFGYGFCETVMGEGTESAHLPPCGRTVNTYRARLQSRCFPRVTTAYPFRKRICGHFRASIFANRRILALFQTFSEKHSLLALFCYLY